MTLRIIVTDARTHRLLTEPNRVLSPGYVKPTGVKDPILPLASTRSHVKDRIESMQGRTVTRVTLHCCRCDEPIRGSEPCIELLIGAGTRRTLVTVHADSCVLRGDVLAPLQRYPTASQPTSRRTRQRILSQWNPTPVKRRAVKLSIDGTSRHTLARLYVNVNQTLPDYAQRATNNTHTLNTVPIQIRHSQRAAFHVNVDDPDRPFITIHDTRMSRLTTPPNARDPRLPNPDSDLPLTDSRTV